MQTRLRKTGLAASIAIITLAVILAIGSTFSLFTSNSGNNIDVNSAKVEVTSELTGLTPALLAWRADDGRKIR